MLGWARLLYLGAFVDGFVLSFATFGLGNCAGRFRWFPVVSAFCGLI